MRSFATVHSVPQADISGAVAVPGVVRASSIHVEMQGCTIAIRFKHEKAMAAMRTARS